MLKIPNPILNKLELEFLEIEQQLESILEVSRRNLRGDEITAEYLHSELLDLASRIDNFRGHYF